MPPAYGGAPPPRTAPYDRCVTSTATAEAEGPETGPGLARVPRISPSRPVPLPVELPPDRARGWAVTVFITIIAALTRFAGLTSPTDGGTPVFDEKHYVPQGWETLRGGIEDNPGFGLVVHPPVGKQLLAFGEWLFGYGPLGWRFMSALCGTLVVFLVVRMTRRLARSTYIGAIAGILVVADGMLFVTSRVGMLDIFLVTFVIAALSMLLVDRDQARDRMYHAWAAGRVQGTTFGPRLGVRWWRFGAGAMLGLACGTKWSGLYFIAFFGLLSVAFDVANRRAHGVRRPWTGTLLRDVLPALWALTAIPLLVYLATWTGWFRSETGVYRHIVGQDVGEGGPWSWIPAPLRALWFYSGSTLDFHSSLTTSSGHVHPWESKPWTWPMGLRPLLYYYSGGEGVTGCGGDHCVRAIKLIGTPAMWWLALPLLAWALWCAVIRHDPRFTVVLVGYAAGYLPWFANLDRQMYYFYAAPMAPFLVIGLALVCGQILGDAGASPRRRRIGLWVVCGYIGLVVTNFVWLWPVLTGMPITHATWVLQQWLPSWA